MGTQYLIRRIWQSKRIKYCVPIILLCFPFLVFGAEDYSTQPNLLIFYSPSCHKCIKAKQEVLPKIADEFKGRINLDYRDIADIDNYKLLLSLKEKYGPGLKADVPVFFLEGRFLQGEIDAGALRNFINSSLRQGLWSKKGDGSIFSLEDSGKKIEPSPFLLEHFKSFTPLAIIVLGLTDGINPCAFTVIVFFISFLALHGYRRKQLLVIGFSFICAVFLTYLLIGLGIFNFLYSLKGFWFVIKTVNFCVGILSIILGVLAVYDFFKFRKTSQTEGLLLQLPQAVKNRIHSLVGIFFRRPKGPAAQNHAPRISKLILITLLTGFLVSLLEAVCTGQLYLPTIAFVLKTTEHKIPALLYLLFYNIMFVVPLMAIFFFALLGATSADFAAFLKKRLALIKIIMAVVFFSLGGFLIWRG